MTVRETAHELHDAEVLIVDPYILTTISVRCMTSRLTYCYLAAEPYLIQTADDVPAPRQRLDGLLSSGVL